MKLHEAADAHLTSIGIPYTGLALVTENPRLWRIDFTDEATEEQKAAAYSALTDFEPPEEKPPIDHEKLVELLESKGLLSKQEIAVTRKQK